MPGIKMILSDALSRRPDNGEGNKQDNEDMIMLPEGLFLNLLDQELNDEQTFENNNDQSDPIKTLSVHGLKMLHNHFSKVTVATSVNDIITVNIMDMDPKHLSRPLLIKMVETIVAGADKKCQFVYICTYLLQC